MKKYLFYILLSFIMIFSFSNSVSAEVRQGKHMVGYCTYSATKIYSKYNSNIRISIYSDDSITIEQSNNLQTYNYIDISINLVKNLILSKYNNEECYDKFSISLSDGHGVINLGSIVNDNVAIYTLTDKKFNMDNIIESNITDLGDDNFSITCKYPAYLDANTYYNTIEYNSSTKECSMVTNTYDTDIGYVVTMNEKCSADIIDYFNENKKCMEGFEYGKKASYVGSDEYQEKYEKRGDDSAGFDVKTCEGLIGDNTLILLRKFRNLIMIIGPILALVLGTYDLVVAMANGEEEAKKKGMKKMKGRLIAAALLLLVPYILDLLLNIINTAGKSCV